MRAEGWSLWHHVSCHPIGIVRMCWMSLRSRRASLIRSDSLRVESSSGLDPSTWWVSEEDFCLILPEPQRKGWMDGWWMDDRGVTSAYWRIWDYKIDLFTQTLIDWSIFCFSLADVVSPASEDSEVVGVHWILRKQGQYNNFKAQLGLFWSTLQLWNLSVTV